MSKPVKNLASFRAAHDRSVIVPAKIRAALASLRAADGEQGWEYEGVFIKRAGISQTDVGAHREQFSDHVVETKGKGAKRAWFVSVKIATEARKTQV